LTCRYSWLLCTATKYAMPNKKRDGMHVSRNADSTCGRTRSRRRHDVPVPTQKATRPRCGLAGDTIFRQTNSTNERAGAVACRPNASRCKPANSPRSRLHRAFERSSCPGLSQPRCSFSIVHANPIADDEAMNCSFRTERHRMTTETTQLAPDYIIVCSASCWWFGYLLGLQYCTSTQTSNTRLGIAGSKDRQI